MRPQSPSHTPSKESCKRRSSGRRRFPEEASTRRPGDRHCASDFTLSFFFATRSSPMGFSPRIAIRFFCAKNSLRSFDLSVAAKRIVAESCPAAGFSPATVPSAKKDRRPKNCALGKLGRLEAAIDSWESLKTPPGLPTFFLGLSSNPLHYFQTVVLFLHPAS